MPILPFIYYFPVSLDIFMRITEIEYQIIFNLFYYSRPEGVFQFFNPL